MAPPSIVPLGMAALFLPLSANVVVTTLIAVRIWHLSPHKESDLGLPSGMAWAAISVVVESGMLYLVAQLTFVTLFAIQHPANNIAQSVAVQIYVRRRHHLKGKRIFKTDNAIAQGIAPALIIIRVALGLSNTPFSSSRTAAGSTSRSLPSATQVRIGFSTSAFSDSHSKEIPMSPIRSKPGGGVVGLGSSFSSVEIAGVA